MRRIVRAIGIGLPAFLAPFGAWAQDTPVDLELVLAIDVSQSVDSYEAFLQRNGYIRALADPQVLDALLSGPYGRVAVTYIEWSGLYQRRTVADWQIIDSAESARAFADRLGVVRTVHGEGTSISFAIRYGMSLFADNGVVGERRVIDISGDGPNNGGELVHEARDAAVAAGIIINGVAINNFDGSNFSLPDLDVYYRECVIGGPGSFVIAADGFESFAAAIRRKLILEVAGRQPDVLLAGFQTVQDTQKYAPDCDIGERMRFMDTYGGP